MARRTATAASVAAVLVSCGLAAMSTSLPEARPAARQLLDAPVAPAPAGATVASLATAPEPVLLQKVTIAEQAVATKPTRPAASIAGMKHVWQSLNNCGPASVVMLLSTLGVDADQEDARLALRGPDVRRGMGPQGVDQWVQKLYGLRAVWRNNGTNALLKTLLSNGFAPMVTQWMEEPTVSRIAHWRAVAGYDDQRGVFNVSDPMRGRIGLTYEWFDRNWQPFNYRYLVIYKPEDEAVLKAIVNADWSERGARQRFYERARDEALERGDAWSLLAYGEAAYQNGMFDAAVVAFEKGLSLGSAEGVFTLRSSYPQALRALGRHADADRAQQRLSGTAAASPVAPAPDGVPLQLALERLVADRSRITP